MLGPGRVIVVVLLLFLPRGRPRLIRKEAVGRIDDATRPADLRALDATIEIFAAAYWIGQRRRSRHGRCPDPLDVRLAVGQPLRRPRPGRCGPIRRAGLLLTTKRHRRHQQRRANPESDDQAFGSHLAAPGSGYGYSFSKSKP